MEELYEELEALKKRVKELEEYLLDRETFEYMIELDDGNVFYGDEVEDNN